MHSSMFNYLPKRSGQLAEARLQRPRTNGGVVARRALEQQFTRSACNRRPLTCFCSSFAGGQVLRGCHSTVKRFCHHRSRRGGGASIVSPAIRAIDQLRDARPLVARSDLLQLVFTGFQFRYSLSRRHLAPEKKLTRRRVGRVFGGIRVRRWTIKLRAANIARFQL
jgi:hypothetical protein